jgi:type II secretion system protein H
MTRARRQRPGGFTLVELIVVMTLLAVVLALSAPRLSGFVIGRNVEEESRRFLALTRYARSEAIARSERMELWMNGETGEYGVRLATGPVNARQEEEDTGAVTFLLDERIRLELDGEQTGQPNEAGETTILFWPDGTIDESSPTRVRMVEGEIVRKSIALTANRLRFVIEEAADARM